MRDDNTEPRDQQQIADDNQQAGESINGRQRSGDARQPTDTVPDQDVPNRASNRDPAEGSRETDDAPPRAQGEEGPLD